MVGTDVSVDKDATLGVAFGWMHGNAIGRDSLAGTKVGSDSFQFIGYGMKRMGPATVNGMLGVGYNRFSQSRAINFLNETATADYGGMAYMARIDGSWDFALSKQVILGPIAGFQAVRSDNDKYTETGAGAANLTVGRQIVDSYATTFGMRGTTTYETEWGALSPEIKVAWVHDLNDSPIPTHGVLGGVNFTTSTPRSARDGAQTTLGLTLQQDDSLSFHVEYSADLRADYQSHTGQMKIKLEY